MKKVIFACVHNAGRSQMAAAFFNALADPSKAHALSAGTKPAEHVHPEVLEVMRNVGLDLTETRPRQLTPELLEGSSLLVTMGCGEECPLLPGVQRDDWPVEDPKGKPSQRVREIRDEIRRRVEALLQKEDWASGSTSPSLSSAPGKPGVLFLCTANSARSQIAEALLREQAPDRFEVYSAGLKPAAQVHPLARQVLEERGIATSTLRPKDLKRFLAKVSIHYAIIVCEKAAQNCPSMYPFALQTLYWPFEDAAAFGGSTEQRLQKFREVRDRIESRLRAWTEELAATSA
jgi:arsenate reductase